MSPCKTLTQITRLNPGMKEVSDSARLAKLGLMTLEERCYRLYLIEVFKMVNGLSKVTLETFLEFDAQNRTEVTRSS